MFETADCTNIVLLDFGITKFEHNEKTEIIGMSYFYSAPEVSIIQKSLVSSKSDIFSFGMCVYFYLSIY